MKVNLYSAYYYHRSKKLAEFDIAVQILPSLILWEGYVYKRAKGNNYHKTFSVFKIHPTETNTLTEK